MLLNFNKYRAYVNIIGPLPVMVMSPHEWKILEWDEKPQKTFPEEIGIRNIFIQLFMFVNHKLKKTENRIKSNNKISGKT